MARPRWQAWGKLAIKAALGALVLWAVGRHVVRTWHDLHEKGGSLRVDPSWIALSVGLYLVGLCGFGVVLRAGHAGEPDPAGPGRGDAGLSDQPPGQVRPRQGDGGRDAGRPGDALRGEAGDGGVRHALRDAGHDGRRGPDRRRRLRDATGRPARAAHRRGRRRPRPARRPEPGPGRGLPGGGRARGLPEARRAWRACRSRASAPMRCRTSRGGCWSRGCSGRWRAGPCWA